MIESNVIRILDMEDKTGMVEVYKNKKTLYFFESMKILMKSKSFSLSFYVVLKITFFLQTVLELVSLPTEYPDLIHEIAVFISDFLLFDRLMMDETSFKNMYTLMFIFTFIYMLLILYLLIYVKKQNMASFPISALNMLNTFLYEFLIIPIVHICLEILRCKDVNGVSTHFYMNVACYSSGLHLAFLLTCVVILGFYFSLIYVISYYMNEIGSINDAGIPARVNCYYEFLSIIVKLLIHITFRIVKIYWGTEISIFNYTKMVSAVLAVLMLVYTEKKVYYFLELYNMISFTGWAFLIWSSLVSLLKAYCSLVESTIFHIGGWLGIYAIIYMIESQKQSDILSNLNPFNLNSIKEVVSFAERILCFCSTNVNYKAQNRGTSMALATTFEEMIEGDEHLLLSHYKFINDDHVMEKFKNKTDLVILSTINLVYDHYQQKNKLYGDRNSDLDEENIFLHACYFLINDLKNVIYSAYLCSTVKVKSFKNNFMHYMMTECVREKMMTKLRKFNNNESIKRIELGNLLAHQYYSTLLYAKINEEINKQCDYFSIFQKAVMNKMKGNTKHDSSQGVDAEQFLLLGEGIISVKKDIEMAYKQLCLIYPTEEVKHNFINYVIVIAQDDDKAVAEEKHFVEVSNDFLKTRGPIYRSLFKPNSLMVLVDGYINVGTVLYATSNFGNLFTVDLSNVVTLTVHDLVPTAIEEFHYEVVMNGIKYSNLSVIFNKQRCLFIRGVSPNIYLGIVYIRCLPMLKNGLNYLISVLKVEENNSLSSWILDSEFKLNGISNFNTFNMDSKAFKLMHVAFYIPNIFLHIKHRENYGFYFDDSVSEYIGVVYKPVYPFVFKGTKMTMMEKLIQTLFEKIKVWGQLENSMDDEDFNYFMQEIESNSEDNFLVHYRIKTRGFVNNKYKYSSIFINKTGGLNESKNHDDMISNSVNSINSNEEEKEGAGALSNLFSAFSAASQCSQASSFIMITMKEKLYNINSTKNDLIKKEGNILQFRIMKYLCVLFFLVSLMLTLISKSITETNFESMNTFLTDNLYFNQTKMLMTSVYAFVNNLKYQKHHLYDAKDQEFMVTKTLDCVNDIRELERKIISFPGDIKTILNTNFTISLRTGSKTMLIGVEEYLNLILSMSLKFTSEIKDYMKDDNSIHELLVEDLDDLIYGYLTDPSIVGFDSVYEESKFGYGNYFSINNIIFSVNIAIILVIIFLFVYFNFSVLTIEQDMLQLIVNFTTPMFMAYLTSLVDYQKRISVDKEEEEIEEEEHSNAGIDSKLKKNKTKDPKKDEKNKKKEEDKNKNKKKGEVKNNDKEEKSFNTYTLISNFFKSKSMYTVFKVVTVLFLSLFFYIISILLINSNMRKVLDFNYSTNEMEMYFFRNFQNYVAIKKQISEYIDQPLYVMDFNQVEKPIMGTALFDVKNNFLADDADIINLNNIFMGDVCQLLFPQSSTAASSESELIICQKYLDNLLINGIDQTITQINVFLSAFIPEMMFISSSSKDKNTALKYIFNKNNFFLQFEEFTTKYLYMSYMFFSQTVNNLKTSYISTLFSNFNILEYFFLVFWAISMFLNFIFVNKIRQIFLSFMNFIFIVPSKQILEDDKLMKGVNNLKNYL